MRHESINPSKPLDIGDHPGPGFRTPSPKFVFELLDLPLFDSQTLSDVPHNAYHDARTLRAYVPVEERPWPRGSGPPGVDEGNA